MSEITLPCILHWDQNHFVVLVDTSKNKVKIADPGKGIITYTKNEFLNHWISSETENNDPVLEHIDLFIPQGKVTAIVGISGGKTTLLKILLKVYEQYDGEIRIGAMDS